MPNRVLRDWTASEKIDKISFPAEALFIRLMMKADDYGSYHANPKLIKSFCFPLKNIRETEISRWLYELESAGIIAFYDAENKHYLHIIDFGQRLRTMSSKYPQIPVNQLNKITVDIPPQIADIPPPETEVETEVEVEKKESVVVPTTRQISFKTFTKEDFKNSIANNAEEFSKEMLNKFYQYWTEPSPSGKMRFQLEKTWETSRRLNNWKSRERETITTDSTTTIKRKRL